MRMEGTAGGETAVQPPLYVDLDGTLVKTDLVVEALFRLLRRQPWIIVVLPFWWVKGRGHFKHQIAARVAIDSAHLPYSETFVAHLRRLHDQGLPLVLATGAPQPYAEAVATHTGLFDAVLHSTAERNLTGARKLELIRAHANGNAFDYAGNGRVDLPIWRAARQAVLVNAGPRVRRRARAQGRIGAEFSDRAPLWRALVRALRPHQWLKNVLLFVPAVAGHRIGHGPVLAADVLGVIGFSAAASAGYVFNDVLDAAVDRAHPRKRRRPFAAGDLLPTAAVALIPALLGIAAGVSLFLPWAFGVVLLAYLVLNTVYSLALKRRVLIDVFALAALYTLRIFAGGAAAGIVVSAWLLAFSVFLFFSLSLVKRYAELVGIEGDQKQPAGRGYTASDAPFVQSAGLASGYLAVMVLALYINSPAVQRLYANPQLLWGLCALALYWITRVWLVTTRGQMHDDPVVFAITDRVSLVTGACAALVMLLAVA